MSELKNIPWNLHTMRYVKERVHPRAWADTNFVPPQTKKATEH